jgi:archaellum component FlaC
MPEVMGDMMHQIDHRFNKIESRMDEIENKINRLVNTIDGFVKRLDENETENAARDAQFERLVTWAKEVSEKTGISMPQL